MKTKLLVINLQNPNSSKYIPANTVGNFLLGRRSSNYVLLMTPDNVVIDVSAANGDCEEIQRIVTAAMNGMATEYKLKKECTKIYMSQVANPLVYAVQYYRETTGSGLKEAVDFVKSLPCYFDR